MVDKPDSQRQINLLGFHQKKIKITVQPFKWLHYHMSKEPVVKELLLGKEKDPLDKKTRKHIALSAFLAWVGLGADGLSSSCYGPQEAYLALGEHSQLAFYLAIAIAITVFIISYAYNQVIELFPNGGGGYKVATELLGSKPGLIAGSALLVDYVLTIVISVASGTDALFSIFPSRFLPFRLYFEFIVIGLLIFINLRGMKEAIKVLLPIFLGFLFTHLFMIVYGIFRHGEYLPQLVTGATQETFDLSQSKGIVFTLALFLHAYAIGGGTYTGLEAVSNNVNVLKEPRQRTGKWTMFFMAVSLSLTAAGIMFLYLLWSVHYQPGQTLNAITFRAILHDWSSAEWIVTTTLLFEFGLLFVGANTGFLGGPAVLSNMAIHSWVPNKFRNLSSQLVAQNGILIFGFAAITLRAISKGQVGLLIILYSINVFLAFAISIFGLCRFWLNHRKKYWLRKFILALIAFVICASILMVVVFTQFLQGGLEAIALTLAVVGVCLYIKKQYQNVDDKLLQADKLLIPTTPKGTPPITPTLNPKGKTAVFFVNHSKGAGIHTMLWVKRLFGETFDNFIFVSVGIIDVESYGADKKLQQMTDKVEMGLSFFVNYAHHMGISAESHSAFGIDPVKLCSELANKITKQKNECVFFASQLVLPKSNWLQRQLHNNTAFEIQRALHLNNHKMMILPMKLQ